MTIWARREVTPIANLQNPVKAIRAKCIDCCCGNQNEVELCPAYECPLYPFRFGKNPYRTKREMTDEQKQHMREVLAAAREKQKQ